MEIVRPALGALGTAIGVRKTLVRAEEQASVLGFVSSPTIMVNGRDIAGEPIESSCSECGELCDCGGGVDCRVWDYRGERHNEAPAGLIVEAILAEVAPSGAPRGEETPEAAPSAGVPENLGRFFAGTAATKEVSSCCSTAEQAALRTAGKGGLLRRRDRLGGGALFVRVPLIARVGVRENP